MSPEHRNRHCRHLALGAILASVCVCVFSQAHAAACCDVSHTNDGFLALRTGPGAQFPMIKQIPSGDAVCFGSINPSHPNTGDWIYGWHTEPDGQPRYGWVHSQYLEDNCG